MILFTHLDRQAVVRTKQGVYKQVKLELEGDYTVGQFGRLLA